MLFGLNACFWVLWGSSLLSLMWGFIVLVNCDLNLSLLLLLVGFGLLLTLWFLFWLFVCYVFYVYCA